MSIEQCIKNELETKTVGVTGILSDNTFHLYRRCESGQYFCLPDEKIAAIFRGDMTTAAKDRLSAVIVDNVRRFKRCSPWMNVITFATPALEVLSRRQLSALNLELFSLNEVIAQHCMANGIHRPALLGTEWDTALDSPLVKVLAKRGIEAQRLGSEKERMYRLMTACVLSQMNSYIDYDGPLKEAKDFCADVAKHLLYETAGTLDAFIICNAEMSVFIPYLRSQCLKGSNAAIPIINASALHLTALTTSSFEKPPS